MQKDKFSDVLTQFIKFGMVGLSNTILSYVIYSFLVYIGLYYIISSVIAFFVSVLNSFYWNNKYVFKCHNNHWFIALLKMTTSYAFTGLVLQNIFLFLFVEYLKVSKYIAPLIILIITVPLNFFINKYWSFKENE